MKTLLFIGLCILFFVSYSSACKCTREYRPVCYQGITYSNACMLMCSRLSQGRRVQYNNVLQGPCRLVNEFMTTKNYYPNSSCRCSKNYSPVCVQGRTYDNFCAARCRFGEDLDLLTVTSGACESAYLDEEMEQEADQEAEYSCHAGQTYIPGQGCVNCYIYPSLCRRR